MNIKAASRILHNKLFMDADQSLCSRAWQQKDVSLAWRFWTYVFGRKHCERSYRHYHGSDSE